MRYGERQTAALAARCCAAMALYWLRLEKLALYEALGERSELVSPASARQRLGVCRYRVRDAQRQALACYARLARYGGEAR